MVGVILASVMTVTNLAGNVISAEPAALKKYPLSIFPVSEQKRIKAGTRPACPSADEMPPKLRPLASELATQRRRDEARLKAKRLTPERAATNAANRAVSWRHAVDLSALSPEEKKIWRDYKP